MPPSETRSRFGRNSYDAIVVGSGPNGLAAAIIFAQKGYSVAVVEAQNTAGGGCRSAMLTLPGFVHDICSSIHPFGVGSPFFRTLPLEKHGLEWVHPAAPYAHPFDDGQAIIVERSVEATAAQLGADEHNYRRLMGGLLPEDWEEVCHVMRNPWQMAKYPLAMMRFGVCAMQSVQLLVNGTFREQLGKGTFTGVAAHSSLRMDDVASASFGLALGLSAHAVGWPMPRGGAQKLTDALVAYLLSLGGELVTGAPINSLAELPERRFLFLDITPQQVLKICGDNLPAGYRMQLQRYKYGPGSFKMDWALDGPIPWAAKSCARAATVHIGGTFEQIAAAERGNWFGEHALRPYVLLAQTTLFDQSRAPAGKHTAWAYCHVPNGSSFDMSERIENQIESYAPGFKKLILARSVLSTALLEAKNANYIGGDINGGALTIGQLFTRPVVSPVPWATPIKNMYLCSSATPPGAGVHGMCGYYAAHAALRGFR